mgnify:CR=1 FL=1
MNRSQRNRDPGLGGGGEAAARARARLVGAWDREVVESLSAHIRHVGTEGLERMPAVRG